MKIDPAVTAARDVYQLLIHVITPRPIAWVSTVSARGITNLAPFSFFNGVAANPPTLVFSVVNRRDGTPKDTVRNILANGEFVVNVVDFANAAAMNATSAELPYEESEFAASGCRPLASERVAPPRVAESPVALECTLHQLVEVGTGPLGANLIIGRIVLMHVADRVVGPGGLPDPALLDSIGRMGGDGYARTRERFDLPRPLFQGAGTKPKTRP